MTSSLNSAYLTDSVERIFKEGNKEKRISDKYISNGRDICRIEVFYENLAFFTLNNLGEYYVPLEVLEKNSPQDILAQVDIDYISMSDEELIKEVNESRCR